MKAYAHTVLKQNNSHLLLHHLYIKQNATMYDLVQATHLSQSSVRNMLRQFEENKIVKTIGVDESTGGRCPIRFSLNPDFFSLICLFVHKDYAECKIMKLYEVIESIKIEYTAFHQLANQIKGLIKQYDSTAIVMAVEGIVDQHMYYTDHEDQYIKNDWIDHLQQQLTIPIYIENDVKCMQRGIYKHDESVDNFVYLYISSLGMGGSVMVNGTILNGHKGIMGELGLIPYQDKTINQAIRVCQNEMEFNQIMSYLLVITCTSNDPQKIKMTSRLSFPLNLSLLKQQLKTWVHQEYCLELEENPDQCLFDGLEYLGIMNLIKKIAEEQ
ncbi:ROK family protein [Beduini massiliensis]|uniref:ROK family protein n=1 Tax=Beduini massiliensis TaxID=1585974 RepID=UPI00059A8DFF|nr:ROK family protein [Beduini massiliensis]